MPSCVTCSITNHNSHKISEIEDTAREFKKSFRRYIIDDVSVITKNLKERPETASEQAESIIHTVEEVEKEIKKRSEEIYFYFLYKHICGICCIQSKNMFIY